MYAGDVPCSPDKIIVSGSHPFLCLSLHALYPPAVVESWVSGVPTIYGLTHRSLISFPNHNIRLLPRFLARALDTTTRGLVLGNLPFSSSLSFKPFVFPTSPSRYPHVFDFLICVCYDLPRLSILTNSCSSHNLSPICYLPLLLYRYPPKCLLARAYIHIFGDLEWLCREA